MIRGLPSKKIAFLIIACVIGVGAVGFSVYFSKKAAEKKLAGANFGQELQVIQKAAAEKAVLDDDNDGLLNWEESLWNTNPQNPDTDGDNTKDGDETKLNRNPAKAGPNDAITADTLQNNTSQTGGAQGTKVTLENTETAELGRDLFAAYLEAKRLGISIDPETRDKIIARAVTGKIGETTAKKYSLANIKTTTSSDFRAYGDAMGQAYAAGTSGNTENEMEILKSALSTENEAELAKLKPIIADYSAILAAAEQVPVPTELADQHIALLNSISAVRTDIESFTFMFSDPLRGMVAIGTYFNDVTTMVEATRSLVNTLTAKGVTYTDGEYGYIFMHAV